MAPQQSSHVSVRVYTEKGCYTQTLPTLTPLPPPLHGYGMVRHTTLPLWLTMLDTQPTYGIYLARLPCARAIEEHARKRHYNSVTSATGSAAPVLYTGYRNRRDEIQHPLTFS